MALDRSGSMVRSTAAIGPGWTRQVFARPVSAGVSTCTPLSRSIATVMSMCGMDGTGGPTCCP